MSVIAPVSIPNKEQDEVRLLEELIGSGQVALVGPEGEKYAVPTQVRSLFLQVLRALRDGKAVSITRYNQQLTTQEAANLLGVSRQFLVNLLESGAIPFFSVGTHRRLYLQDVLDYRNRRDERRRDALRELSRASSEAGLYDHDKVVPREE